MDRQKLLEGKTERQQLELKAHWALADLADYFKLRNSPLQYEINRLWRGLDRIRDINIELDERRKE